jgi:hypothetical protein
VETADWGVVKKYVEMGFGVSVIPEIVIQPNDRKRLFLRDLTKIKTDSGISEYGIIIKRRKYLSRAARANQVYQSSSISIPCMGQKGMPSRTTITFLEAMASSFPRPTIKQVTVGILPVRDKV